MNEVMTLAEDEGLNIWYQDTDSLRMNDKKSRVTGISTQKQIQQIF